MEPSGLDVVTGAFGYTGRYIAGLLLAQGRQVRTLTNHPRRCDPLTQRIETAPLDFADAAKLTGSLQGVDALFNTYWIRFPWRGVTHEMAAANIARLVGAAEAAKVRRIVHISITGASTDLPLPYFRGKGQVERLIREARLSHAIIRPAIIFGGEDILINNIAWMLRRFPVFAVPGDGAYRLQPIFVEDLARLAVDAARADDNMAFDGAGPEFYTFNELLRLIAGTVGSRARFVHLNPRLAYLAARMIGYLVHDVILTADEVEGLTRDLLVSKEPPRGTTRLSVWFKQNAAVIGLKYASEVARRIPAEG